MLVALSGGAAGLSIATSPNDAAATANLDQAVETMLGSHSFTVVMKQLSTIAGSQENFAITERVVFQAPNRSATILPGTELVETTGSSAYETSVVFDGGKAIDTSCLQSPNETDATPATLWLYLLLNADSVERSSNVYRTETLEPLMLYGMRLVRRASVTTVVVDGRIVSEDVSFTGVRGIGPSQTVLDYSGFDTSAPVMAPKSGHESPTTPVGGRSSDLPCGLIGWVGYAPLQG
jgi:hypothetical protein